MAKTARAVIHVESLVLDNDEEEQFFREVGDYVRVMQDSVLLDSVKIVDQVVLMKHKPTTDRLTESQAKQIRGEKK